MVVTKNCFLGNVITAFKLVEKFSPENVAVVGLLPLPNKRTNGVEPLILFSVLSHFDFSVLCLSEGNFSTRKKICLLGNNPQKNEFLLAS